MYHALSDNVVSNKYTLTAEKFRQHLSIIKNLGKSGVNLASQYDNKNNSDSNIIITFDDGHISNAKMAVPILREFKFSATFFVTTNRINNGTEWLKWEDISEMLKLGMDVQVHGHTHVFLDESNAQVLEKELFEPKRLMKEKLSHEVRHFSLPGGRFSKETMSMAKTFNYLSISTSIPGLNDFRENRNFKVLHRFVIHQGVSDNEFKKIIVGNRFYCGVKKSKYYLKNVAKKMLGNDLYQRLWEIIMK